MSNIIELDRSARRTLTRLVLGQRSGLLKEGGKPKMNVQSERGIGEEGIIYHQNPSTTTNSLAFHALAKTVCTLSPCEAI